MHDATEPEVIYHYTSADTLLKIIEHEQLWATDHRYLNDATESDHCLKIMRKRLPDYVRVHGVENAEELGAALDCAHTESDVPFYLTSFSTHADSLTQWRSYCSEGNGVSIGFRTASLRRSSVLTNHTFGETITPKCELSRVTYIKDDDIEKIDTIIGDCISELKRWREPQIKNQAGGWIHVSDKFALNLILTYASCTVKHPAFESEQEYRLLPTSQTNLDISWVKFRASRSTIIPYVRVRFPKWGSALSKHSSFPLLHDDYFIEEIILGPTPNPTLTRNALQIFFNARNISMTIKESSVPYRDL